MKYHEITWLRLMNFGDPLFEELLDNIASVNVKLIFEVEEPLKND